MKLFARKQTNGAKNMWHCRLFFINGPDSMFYAGNEELVKAECKLIKEQQLEDGSFTVPWQWWTEYKEFEVAKVWWKAEMIMEKLLYLHSFGELEEV